MEYFLDLLFMLLFIVIYCAGAEITTLMSISEKLDPYILRRKMEKTRSVNEQKDGEVFISRQSRHFSLYR